MQIGSIEYEARVTGAAEAKQEAQDFADTQHEAAAASEEAATSGGFLAGRLSDVADTNEEAGQSADRTTTKTRILASSLFFLGTTAVGTIGKITGLTGAFALVRGAAGTLIGTLSGLTLSGVIGTVTGALSGFVGWLAAGSVGALAFAGAVGAGLGILGVWILQVTGALDAVRGFGQFVRDQLPGWVRDGLLMLISIAAGPLAAFGGFITGTLEGGFDEGFRRARQIIGVFVGAWDRQIGRIASGATDLKNRAIGQFNQLKTGTIREFTSLKNRAITQFDNLAGRATGAIMGLRSVPGDVANAFRTQFGRIEDFALGATNFVQTKFDQMGSAIVGTVRQAWNSNIPARINLPSATIAGQTIGGGGISIPRLQAGGMVEQTGIAVVHEGESVIPEPITSAAGGGTAGGGGDVTVESVSIRLMGNFDPTDLSRRELEDLADKVATAIGKKAGTTVGVR